MCVCARGRGRGCGRVRGRGRGRVYVRVYDGSIALATICEEIQEELFEVRQEIASAQAHPDLSCHRPSMLLQRCPHTDTAPRSQENNAVLLQARGSTMQHLDADIQHRPNRAQVPSSLAISESEYFADDDNHAVFAMPTIRAIPAMALLCVHFLLSDLSLLSKPI